MNKLTLMKAEQIARMIVQGYGPGRVARLMGLSYEGVNRIRKTPEYKEIEDSVRRNVIGRQDEVLAKRTDVRLVREQMRDELEDALPEAMRVLLQNLREKRDLKAALEILDRDPNRQFTKGSGGTAAQTTNVGVQVGVKIDSKALAQAIDEANKTYEMIERAGKSQACGRVSRGLYPTL